MKLLCIYDRKSDSAVAWFPVPSIEVFIRTLKDVPENYYLKHADDYIIKEVAEMDSVTGDITRLVSEKSYLLSALLGVVSDDLIAMARSVANAVDVYDDPSQADKIKSHIFNFLLNQNFIRVVSSVPNLPPEIVQRLERLGIKQA